MAVRQNHKHKTTLVAYMLVTFGFTWGSWSALVAGSISSGGHYGTNWLFVLGTFGPLLGGAAAIWVGGGRALIFPWVKRIGRIDRRSAYAAALAACGVLAMWAGQLIAVRADPDPAAKSLPMSWATVFALAGWMAMAAGEEAGWRGWLGPFLMRRLGAVGSSLATGAVWTLWHVPMFVFREGYPLDATLVGVVSTLLAASVVLTAITQFARASVWPAIVWQGGFSLMISSGQAATIGTSVVVVTVGIAVLVYYVCTRTARTRRPSNPSGSTEQAPISHVHQPPHSRGEGMVATATMPERGTQGSSRFIALGVLCLAELVGVMDNTVINVGVPTLARAFEANTTELQWVVDAYTLAFAVLMLPGGYIGDRFGRRKIMILGLVGFAAVSTASALATDFGLLIGLRAVLGLFAAMVFPATLSLISTIFSGSRHHALAVGLWTATAGVGIALGPVVGGLLLRYFDWSALFWINVAIVLPAALAARCVVPESRTSGPSRAFDLAGGALAVAAAAFGVGAVIEGPRLGWTSIQTLGGLGLAAVALWAFVVRERRVRDPLLDLSLFGDRAVAAGASAIALAFFALFGFTFAITMYFQSIRGYSALGAGLAIVPFAIVMSAGSPLAPQLALRFGAQRCICGGLVLMGAGFLVVSFANESSSYWLVMVPAMILMAAGLSFIQGPATDIIMTAAPRDRVGVVSAVNDSIREIGGTIGVAVLGSVLAYEYSTNMSQIAASSPILAPASHSIMAARQVAEAMPASSMREELVRVATDSFINALRMDCLILTVVTLIAALGVGLVFPSGNRCKLSVDPAGS